MELMHSIRSNHLLISPLAVGRRSVRSHDEYASETFPHTQIADARADCAA